MDREYLSKCKRKIKKAAIDDKLVEVTERKVQLWFNVINSVLFKNELPRFNEIKIVENKDYYGMCECHNDSFYKLFINSSFNSKKMFIEVMIHEMIHLYDYVVHGRMGHGKRFFEWKEKVEKFGLRLYKTL